jgi:phosphatidylglycerol lysyltransferase
VKTVVVWLIGHAARFLPFFVIAAVLALTWQGLRQVHPHQVRLALQRLEGWWLTIAGLLTIVNIAVMGLYDVIAFTNTRSRWSERWKYGAVAFAWSNFLTLGPLAGPAIRFWLYRPAIDRLADLETGVLSITIAFASGLAGWTLAVLIVPSSLGPPGAAGIAAAAFAIAVLAVHLGTVLIGRLERFGTLRSQTGGPLRLALIGWLDWLIAAAVFVSCVRATGATVALIETTRAFFIGQAIGLASLIPGGFGSSDAFWIAHLPFDPSVATAALVAYRIIYYVLPWAAASLLLLSWATRRTSRRIELARRIVAGLVGGGGAIMLLSTASPALHSRILLLEQLIPLPLVELSHATAALTGVLLLVLARGLAKGYRAALRATIIMLTLGGFAAILKGLDWEEALLLGTLALAAWSQAALFDRRSHGDWLERRDLIVAVAALLVFLVFGAFAHRITAQTLSRYPNFGYRFERARFIRSAASLVLAVSAAGLYALLRVPVKFSRLPDTEIDRALALHAAIGHDTAPMMVANADKAVFFDDDRGFCLYRTVGHYLAVFSDPVVRSVAERGEFLNALFGFAGELDRRPLFYQISLEWVPPLHDRGYAFFKLGEEAHVILERVTLEGHTGKMYRQILRRAERDGARFRVIEPAEVERVLAELQEVSDDWLSSKKTRERQFSIGFFDSRYLKRFPCAIVEEASPPHRILAFANLLSGPHHEELSVDLMRYRSEGPKVMDFLFVSLFFYAKDLGYERFNLGMAPLANVGELSGAHARERLANLLFQRGENWYNFQGLRFYKQKFDPEWVPRYLAYQNAWEWPAAITNVSALIAGGWARIVFPTRA